MTSLVIETTIRNQLTNELLSKDQYTYIIRGIGGFGHTGTIKNQYPEIPQRKPDFVSEEKTNSNQAMLYRLNGDLNELHIDP